MSGLSYCFPGTAPGSVVKAGGCGLVRGCRIPALVSSE